MGVENSPRQNTKDETKSIIDAAGFAFNQAKNQNHLSSKSRSEVVYKKEFPKPKVKANSVIEFNSTDYYNNNSQYNQINSRFATKPSNASPRAWSDVTYRPHDTRTELTNYSDPGPQVYNPQRKQTFNFPPRVPTATTYENNHNYYPNQHQQPSLYSEARSPKPRIAASAMMDIGDNVAQPRTTEAVKPRKFLDLRISNKSLLSLNVVLESTVKEQSDKLAIIPSFEAMMETQKKQVENLNKVEKLICTLSTKMTEQDNEIKVIKSQIIEKSDEKEKTRVTLFYDPKSLPLNSLPNIIFDRVYDDITILFSVVTSLLYTVYIFPVIVVARTAKQLVDKSKCVIEDFVPSGVKNFQKKLKAKKSLQILVTHLTVQPPDPLISQDAKQQQLYMLRKYQKFLYTLLKNYFLQDFFDVIIDNKDADQNDRFYEWKEFISLICSIPDRYLTQVLKSLTTTWSDTTFVKHASNSLQLYVTSAILIIFGYLPKEILLKINIYKDIGVGTTQWMKSSFDRTRKIAMITVEMLSWLLDENDDVLDFKLDPQDEEVKTLRQLVDAKDGLNNLLIINTEEEDDDDNENRSFKRNKDINDENNSQSISVITNSFEEDFDQSSNVIDEDETTKLVGDSDDEDDFEPYSMDESDFDENEEDYDTLATKPKNTLPPVYIIDLIKMLKAAEDPEKIEIAMNTAEKLIRLKTNFGTELDENANELARVLISINNTFELKEFEEKRHAALTALVVGSPKNTVLYIIKEFFEKRYSLSEKITMLSVLASGAKELAGIEQPEEIEVRRESSIIDLLSKQTSGLSVNAIETSKEPSPSSNNKVNRFSRKPMVQSIHSSSIKVNRFNEFAAKPFFFPLSAGFWNWIRNRDTINKGMYEPILLSKYITTLATIVQCSTNTVENLEISKEFWDMILSLRYFDDVAVVSSLLFGISVILKALPEQELATFFSKDLIETNQWVTNLFENNPNEYVKSISAWIMVKIDQIISKYRRLLIGDLLPIV
ncbi:2118_t:CDS:10 [Entrophospora sp. SA101]|nr:2118_t:CDS:10 [Entrophospora sp. SA101]